MRFDAIMWIEEEIIYKAIYYAQLERMIIRTVDGDTGLPSDIIYIRDGMSAFDWNVFKLGILKWKN